MPDLLLELFSEEIPARMQRQAAEDLRRLVTDGLVEAGLTYEGAKAFATPRRLALTVHGVTARSADIREERKGPRVGAPDKALEGFLRAAGLASIDQAEIQSDPKKGDFYVARIARPGRASEDIVAALVPEVIRGFPWPKSMRWGARSAPPDSASSCPEAAGSASLRWVRPLRSILCTFGPETEEPVVVPIEVAGIAAGDVTFGHRFMAGSEPIRVRRFGDYAPALQAAKVVLDADRRKAIVETEAKNLAFAQGLEVVDDPGLLEEVAGLVEWPVVLMGRFDEAFLDIPPEVIRLTIRNNQKCFVLREAADGAVPPPSQTGEGDHAKHGGGGKSKGGAAVVAPSTAFGGPPPPQAGEEPRPSLTNRFILVSNIEASDGGKAIVAGNERVVAARLSDARFFWEQDKAVPLEKWAEKLAGVTFHEKLGSQAERVERIARLSREIAPLVGADPDDAERAARLAKADLATGMVGEFPELQGVMGRYYFLAQIGLSSGSSLSNLSSRFGRKAETGTHKHDGAELGSSDVDGSRTGAGAPSGMTDGEGGEGEERLRAIADAIRDHYKPQGPNDSVPREPVSVAVALADKLDTLVGFWAIDEKPTGSKDPYALRRAALGVIRIILSNELRLPFENITWSASQPIIYIVVEEEFEEARKITEYMPALSVIENILDMIKEQKFLGKALYRMGAIGEFHGMVVAGRADMASSEMFEAAQNRFRRRVEVAYAVLQGRDIPFEEIEFDNVPRESEYRAAEKASVFIREKQSSDLLAFFADRLKVHLRETGARHDLIDAVFALPGQDDLLMIVRRVEALGKFLDAEDGANLLVGYRRAANILRIEEKKDGKSYDDPPDPALIEARGLAEERALYAAMRRAEGEARAAVEREDFAAAMQALARLRPAVDAFFDKVTVNADDPALRENRLRLLAMLRRATLTVADFSRIAG